MTSGNGNGNGRALWWRPETWKIRDALCFGVGFAWLAYEVVIREEPRERFVYIAVLLLLGPAYLQPLADALSRLLLRIMGRD